MDSNTWMRWHVMFDCNVYTITGPNREHREKNLAPMLDSPIGIEPNT